MVTAIELYAHAQMVISVPHTRSSRSSTFPGMASNAPTKRTVSERESTEVERIDEATFDILDNVTEVGTLAFGEPALPSHHLIIMNN